MEFGSRFVYLAKEDEQDVFDEDQLNQEAAPRAAKKGRASGFAFGAAKVADRKSDNEEEEEADLSDAEVDEAEIPSKNVRKVRKQDTNIVALNLGSLADPAIALATGDACFCKQCSVAFSMNSKLEGNNLWKCEYCDFGNYVVLDEPEIPKAESIDYLLSPPTAAKSSDSSLVVFTIDISNSMCVTSEISGDLKVKMNSRLVEEVNQYVETTAYGQRAEQFLPRERGDVSYVSRLQCVQAAVAMQIESMASEHPNKRVAIVAFASDVTIYLPGLPTQTVSGAKLSDFSALLSSAASLASQYHRTVKQAKQELISIVQGLTESGATALGPALLISIGLAGAVSGSSVVLCTDGVANIGLGSLEDFRSDNAANHPAPAFYTSVAGEALQKGVSVSIVTIQGTNTNLEHIAKVAATTKGMTDIVDPLKLDKNFNFILQNAIVATDVSAKMFVHNALFFRHEAQSASVVERQVGNVAKESAITFEYGVKNASVLSGLAQLPFQIQITYTRLDGAKCMRILSRVEKVTANREEAESNMNVNVVGMFAQQTAAALASEGNYTKARMKTKSAMRMVKRNMDVISNDRDKSEQLQAWTSNASKLNNVLKKKKIAEKKSGHHYDSASDDDSGDEAEMNDAMEAEVLAPQAKGEAPSKGFFDTLFGGFGSAPTPSSAAPTSAAPASASFSFSAAPGNGSKQFQFGSSGAPVALGGQASSANPFQPSEKSIRKEERQMSRQMRRTEDDESANVIYQNQNPSYSAYSKKSNI